MNIEIYEHVCNFESYPNLSGFRYYINITKRHGKWYLSLDKNDDYDPAEGRYQHVREDTFEIKFCPFCGKKL